MELYNEEMKGEILVTRRATYKAEEAVSGLEKDKGRQDLFIDRLMEQARKPANSLFLNRGSDVASGRFTTHRCRLHGVITTKYRLGRRIRDLRHVPSLTLL